MSVTACLQPAVCCVGRSEHEGCNEVQLFVENTNQMMSTLLYALGEDGAASEDLAEVVANGGVLLAGTGLVQFASAKSLLICLTTCFEICAARGAAFHKATSSPMPC